MAWDNASSVRADYIMYELAERFHLVPSPALRAFYEAAYATAVFDIADAGLDGGSVIVDREAVIAKFAPS